MTDVEQDVAITNILSEIASIKVMINNLPQTYFGRLDAKSQISVLSGKIAALEAEIASLKNRVTILET